MSKIDKLFLLRPLADQVKDAGFWEECLGTYNDDGTIKVIDEPKAHYYKERSAPTYDQVISWIRKQFKFNIHITRDGGWWILNIQDFTREDEASPNDIELSGSVCFNKYREAQQEGIKEVLKLIKKINNK